MPLPSTQLPAELGEYIARDVELLRRGGWKELVASRRGRGILLLSTMYSTRRSACSTIISTVALQSSLPLLHGPVPRLNMP